MSQEYKLPAPILYSFRRCPYAMRARMIVYYSQLEIELRDVLLKDKPKEMLDASPKATVPVLVQGDGSILEESRDIMQWAANQNDPAGLLPVDANVRTEIYDLLDENDGPFKTSLDRYKYHVRFPEKSREEYRSEGEAFFQKLETRLSAHAFLMGGNPTHADIGIFPFVRQFANSDRDWFDAAPYPNLKAWLHNWVTSDAFKHIMKKRPLWQDGKSPVFFPELHDAKAT